MLSVFGSNPLPEHDGFKLGVNVGVGKVLAEDISRIGLAWDVVETNDFCSDGLSNTVVVEGRASLAEHGGRDGGTGDHGLVVAK